MITAWFNLDYAALLYVVEQIVLAGGTPADTWRANAWYVGKHGGHVTHIRIMVECSWFDATGELLVKCTTN